MFRRLFSFILITALFWETPCGAWDWSRDAVRLTGESDYVREQALLRLKKHTNLALILRDQLQGPKQPLALDVVSALNMTELLPNLMQAAEKDENGFVYLAIVLDLYSRRVIGWSVSKRIDGDLAVAALKNLRRVIMCVL